MFWGLLFTIFLTGCAGKKPVDTITFEDRSNQGLAKHYIFLIHGVGGDQSHFGYLKPALLKALQSEDVQT